MGSVSPLLAIAQKYPADYLFIGTPTGPERAVVVNQGLLFQSINAGKLRRYWSWKNFWDVFKIFGAVFVSIKILLKFKPDIVLSAGSFVAVPIIWVAWILRIPRVIHQQDIKVGLANKLLAPFATKITVTFPEQKELFAKNKVIVTGNPVRQAKKVEESVPMVVITGGGLGARGFNEFVSGFIPQLARYAQVHHILGNENFDQALNLANYYPHKFLAHDMMELLSQSDLIISRGGMSLITEAASLKKL